MRVALASVGRAGLPGVLLVGALALSSGCGNDCQSTCRHVFSESECGISHAGQSTEDSIGNCVSECEFGMQRTGDLDGYDPYKRYPASGPQPELDNDKKAAAWMDCVWFYAPTDGYSSGCEEIRPDGAGFCAPI